MKPYQEQNYYELLEVTPSASMAEIRAAYERAVETYSADSVAIYALENPAQADELRDKLREAMEILTDQGLRGDYDRMIGLPPRPQPQPQPEDAAAPALAAAELMASSEALHSTHPEVKVAYFPTPAPPPPMHVAPPEPAPPPVEPPARPRMTAREIEGEPSIAEQEAIATAEAAMANVAARAREVPRPKPLEIPSDAEFSGELLRRVRESRGLTLQQIADRTRISARHLENIEADRYTALPALVYLRGILMNLARELGLDQGRVSKSYLQLASGKKSKPDARRLTARPADPKNTGPMTEEEKVKAMRLARAIASDISLYNEQKIIKGIEQDNLFEVLKDEIEEGRELYKSRVSQELYTTTNFFDRAIVDIVIRSKAHVKSKIW
jgi:curved DNA-binding protein CbpA